MKKIVLTLDLMDNKAKQKALKTVSTLHGIDSITMEMNTKKLTVTGAVDPVSLVTKLRKYWPETTIVLVGPVKEPEKPAPEKKPEESGGGGGGGDKKETGGGGGDKKPEGDGKKEGAGGGGGEKKDGEKKGDSTKEGEKKEGDGDGKKEGEKTVAKPVQPMVAPPVYFHMPPPQMQYPDMMRGYRPNYYYNSAPHPAQMSMYHHQQQHYYSPSVEENPNACTIC